MNLYFISIIFFNQCMINDSNMKSGILTSCTIHNILVLSYNRTHTVLSCETHNQFQIVQRRMNVHE